MNTNSTKIDLKDRKTENKQSVSSEFDEKKYIPCLWMSYLSSGNQLQHQSKNLMETELNNLGNKNLISEDNFEQYNLTMNYNNFEILKHIDKRKNTKILLFFHGNAEDLGIAHNVLSHLKE